MQKIIKIIKTISLTIYITFCSCLMINENIAAIEWNFVGGFLLIAAIIIAKRTNYFSDVKEEFEKFLNE